MNQSFWALNLKYLRKRKRLSQDDLSMQLSISRSKLNSHENGKTINPPVEDLIRFSEYFKIGIDNLIRVNLSKLGELRVRELEAGNDAYAKGTNLRVLSTTVDSKNRENVELVNEKAKAGYTAGYGDPEYIAALPVFHLPHLPRERKYRMFPITGDSMHPVPDGAWVVGEFLEDWTTLARPTAAILVTHQQGIVFKIATLRTLKAETRHLYLESLNDQYEPYTLPLEEILEVWQFRSLISNQMPDKELTEATVTRLLQEVRTDVKQLLKHVK